MSNRVRFDALNSSLAILASAATIVSVIVGWQWKGAEETATAKTEVAQDLSSTIESVRAERDRVAAQNEALVAENDELKRRLTEEGDAGKAPRALATSVASSIYRQGPLTFQAETYPTDFDAPLDDPQWGRNSQTAWPGEDDVSLNSDGEPYAALGAQLSDPLQGPASYEDCTIANFSDANQSLVNLPDGAVLCVRTTEDRFVGLQLKAHDAAKYTFQVTTWNSGVR